MVPSDSSIRKVYGEDGKVPGLKEKLERMWKLKAKMVPVAVGALGAVTLNPSKCLQQIPETTLKLPGPPGRGPRIAEDTDHLGEKGFL